jgi:translation initiation factor 4G
VAGTKNAKTGPGSQQQGVGTGGPQQYRKTGRDNNNNKAAGRGKQPPLPPVEPLKLSEGRWQRPTSDVAAIDLLRRNVMSLLNKLTFEKFDALSVQFVALKIASLDDLTEVIKLVFEKALAEQHFCKMYANLCKKLSDAYPSFQVVEDGRTLTQSFKRILLNMCQKEFERPPPTKESAQEGEELADLDLMYRRKMLGNIRFIGELFKLGMLREAIMHECMNRLLSPPTTPTSAPNQNGTTEPTQLNANGTHASLPTEEDLEALSKLLHTMGKLLDRPGPDRQKMDKYFVRINALSRNP